MDLTLGDHRRRGYSPNPRRGLQHWSPGADGGEAAGATAVVAGWGGAGGERAGKDPGHRVPDSQGA